MSKKKPFYSPDFIKRMIAGEKAHIALQSYLNYTHPKKQEYTMDKVVIKISYQGFPCELHLEFIEETNIPTSVIGWIDTLKERGFTAPVSYTKSGDDKIGKTGVVDGISKGDKTKTGNQMYIVNGMLDDGREFSWNEFTPSTFRKGDKFKVVKNDRGFLTGEIILPDMRANEIPF